MTLKGFLKVVTEQVRKHGKAQCKPIEDRPSLSIGYESPDGQFFLPLSILKAAFSTGEWREDTAMVERYKKAGGQTPLRALTRLPPSKELGRLYAQKLTAAINEGERLRKLDQAAS